MYHFLTTALQANPMLADALRIAVIGFFLDCVRRSILHIWTIARRDLELTMRVYELDPVYDWLHHYMTVHSFNPPLYMGSITKRPGDPLWKILLEEIWPKGRTAPRDVQACLMDGGRGIMNLYTSEDDEDSVEDEDEKRLRAAELEVFPSLDTTHCIQFQGHTIRFHVRQVSEPWGHRSDWMVISAPLAPHSVFTSLIAQAHREYVVQDHGKLRIFTQRSNQDDSAWKKTKTKPHRAWKSVILPPTVKSDLLKDSKDFLGASEFYRVRGIPYRRGYLLYGSPGAGKSSIIAALAAELKLDIYMVNLSAKGLDDAILAKLLNECPSRCILLMEDLDCATLDREDDNKDDEASSDKDPNQGKKSKGGVTLSGLLNALDGIASSEGRLLFCTTNHVEKIDPALRRPGRCDIWIEFTNATTEQMKDLFNHFYNPTGDQNTLPSFKSALSISAKADQNGGIDEKVNEMIIDEGYERIDHLAIRFSNAIPTLSVSVSAIQGYFMRHKHDPMSALREVDNWVKAGFPQGYVAEETMSTDSSYAEIPKLEGEKKDLQEE